MFVTTTLLASVMYFVWGFIWIIPLGFLLLFGTLDGVFWACTLPLPPVLIYSYPSQICHRSLVPFHGWRDHDNIHDVLEMGNDQETPI